MKKRIYGECRDCFTVTGLITLILVASTVFFDSNESVHYQERPAMLNNMSSKSSFITKKSHSDVADYIQSKLGGTVVSDKLDGVVHVNIIWLGQNGTELAQKNVEVQKFYLDALSSGNLYEEVYLHSFVVNSLTSYQRFPSPITVDP
jgi:hypothetical protein